MVSDRANWPSLFDRDAAVRLHDRLDHSRGVDRTKRTKVYDLSADPFRRKLFGRLQREAHPDAERHERDVRTFAADLCLAKGDREVIHVRHFEGAAIEYLVLEEDHRVRIADCALQKSLCIGGRIRLHDFQTGDLRIPSCVVLTVLRAHTSRRAVRAAEHNGAAHLTARHVQRLGGRIDDMVDRLHSEVESHELHDGAKPAKGRTDCDAREAVFGNWRVNDALASELVQQSLTDLVGALILSDFFTHEIDVFVARHFLGHRLAQCLAHGHGLHCRAYGPIW